MSITAEISNPRDSSSFTFIVGDPVSLSVKIQNNSDKECTILNPVLGKEGDMLARDAFFVTALYSNGAHKFHANYHGITAHIVNNMVSIHPGGTLNFNVSLAKEYLLPSLGHYNVTYIVSPCYFPEGSFAMLEVKSPIIVLESGMDSKQQAHFTWLLLELTDASRSSPLFKMTPAEKVNFSFLDKYQKNANDAQMNQMQKATVKAHENAIASLISIRETKDVWSFTKWWFGSWDYTHLSSQDKHASNLFCMGNAGDVRNSLIKDYDSIEKFLSSNKHVHYVFGHDFCYEKDGTPKLHLYGFVLHSADDEKIYLCNQYINAPTYPKTNASNEDFNIISGQTHDTKSGVIVHEASHKAVHSSDHFYGYDVCKYYASTLSCVYGSGDRVENGANMKNADCLQIYEELNWLTHEVGHVAQGGETGEV